MPSTICNHHQPHAPSIHPPQEHAHAVRLISTTLPSTDESSSDATTLQRYVEEMQRNQVAMQAKIERLMHARAQPQPEQAAPASNPPQEDFRVSLGLPPGADAAEI